ncbi:hypothetical protein [Stutzerimonas kunmingensis]|uniref:hypothetical protein n=1 Tax=Stutzerimonas kunmingensis TaxID=1211807 RepID=UPI002FC9D2C4
MSAVRCDKCTELVNELYGGYVYMCSGKCRANQGTDMTHTPNGEREAAEWLNMLAAQLERPSRCGMYRNIPGLSAGQVYDIAQDMRSAIALLQSPAAPDGGEVADAMFAARGFALNVRDQERRQITTPGHASSSVIECERWLDTFERLLFAFTPPGNDKPRPWRELESAPQSPAAVQQGEASVSTLPDLYWHITRNALRDGSPFAVACMGALPALNAVIATPSPASPEVGPLDDDLQALVSERFADYLDSPAASPEVGSDALRDFVEERDASGETTGYFLFGDAAANTPPPEVGGLVDDELVRRCEQIRQDTIREYDAANPFPMQTRLVTCYLGMRAALTAALAPSRQAGGEAVAWLFEMEEYGEWITRLALSREAGTGHNCRNLRPLYTHPAPSAESADAILDIVGRHVDRETYSAIVRERYDRLAAAPTATDEGKAHG